MSDRRARIADAIARQIHALLAGQGPDVQSAAIADVAAIWLAGHIVPGDWRATTQLRDERFEAYCDLIRELVQHYDKAKGNTT